MNKNNKITIFALLLLAVIIYFFSNYYYFHSQILFNLFNPNEVVFFKKFELFPNKLLIYGK